MDEVMDALDKAASSFENLQLKVGFLEGATYPDGTPVPMVAATNEFGNPANNQPPRPFFRNAIANHESEWQEAMANLIENGGDTRDVLSIIGEIIVDDIKGAIRQLDAPPLSPVTIARKGFDKPLIDTSNMLNSVSYEVSEIESSTDSQ
ncbi:hypothetical protein CWG78_01840 [Salmonella enterica subsp. enterica serovar Halle]|uniref:Uncharacterized protein n=1 Tax=Salmonella enterica subsp. enterica serovar Guildford TaxID=2564497 RepID=A0A636P6Q7_SALET|nr:hypothetical protein [Salmonella enterica subsp. enterica serovar Nima]EBV1210103.1 hypothetical protein [Salmonella enterica subsp. enterica serovar Guildford]EBZ2755971.1 hypothetical protein [Salmonella enterica subsp. enterica serovar Pomona]ECE3713376.1 hypothetical protein [Salmonella enterica]EDL5731369.1 hypothetical protein [Salmonella enterica subsp. enterica serovar Halle]EDQ7217435.1 hypothetical protein [Salmonella enterica subsp. enterica]EFX3900411.1 hypothetical protein [Sa